MARKKSSNIQLNANLPQDLDLNVNAKHKMNISRYIPSALLRLIYSPKYVSSRITIDFRNNTPFYLGSSNGIPYVDIYLDVSNFNNIDMVLDRMLLDMWFGQPTIYAALMYRKYIPAGQKTENVLFRHILTAEQASHIQKYLDKDNMNKRILVHVTGYFESNIGRITVEQNYERSSI